MPYNNPIKKKSSSCMQMKDYKGKPVGLMMEGSVNHMSMLHKETDKQEKENLEGPKGENPIDNRGVGQMSPYKMSHGDSPNKMSPLNDNHDIDPKTGKKITYRLKGTSDMYDAEGFLKPEFMAEGTQDLTPEKMYTRDLGIDQGTPGTADYIPGRQYSQERREIGSVGDRIKLKPGYRYQFTSVSGDTDPFPTNPFITKDFDEYGDVVENAKKKKKKGASGLIGRSFTQQDIKEMEDRFKRYMAPKTKAQEYFKSKKS